MAKKGTTSSVAIQEALRLGGLLFEKCELQEARDNFRLALQLSKKNKDFRSAMEALSNLLRLAGEAMDQNASNTHSTHSTHYGPNAPSAPRAIEEWNSELEALMASHPKLIPPQAWSCKGIVARYREQYLLAQKYFHRYLRAAENEKQKFQAWTGLAMVLVDRAWYKRASLLVEKLIPLVQTAQIPGVLGVLYMLRGKIAFQRKDYDQALRHYQQAHGCFLSEHNWFSHLHVTLWYARIARMQQNYPQAYWYLDLVDKAASGPEFGTLRREIRAEKSKLEQDAVDLLVDSKRGIVRTREAGPISLKKQYVLMNILEALSGAHSEDGESGDQGLSKAQLIEKVWGESYRPEAHDNKLYYNINRLRKLIEPDTKEPQYLLNWREGYRLAPGLRVQWIGNRKQGEGKL